MVKLFNFMFGCVGFFAIVVGAGWQWGMPSALMAAGVCLCVLQWEINA